MSSSDHQSAPENGQDPDGSSEPTGEESIYSLEAQAAFEARARGIADGSPLPDQPANPPSVPVAQGPSSAVPVPEPAGSSGLPGPVAFRAAALHGALTYGAVLLAAVLALVVVAIGAVVSTSSVQEQISNQVGVDPSGGGLLQALALPFQLAGVALLGTLRIALSGSLFGTGFEVGARLWAPPLVLTACGAAAAWWLGLRSERQAPSASTAHRWMLAGVAGTVTALLALLLSAVLSVRVTEDGSGITLTTASVALFFGALLLSTLGAGAGRRSAHSQATRQAVSHVTGSVFSAVTASVSSAARVAAWHYLLFAVPAGVLIVLGVGLAAEPGTGALVMASAPLWIGTAASYAYAVVFLVPLAVSGAGQEQGVGLFDLPGWAAALAFLLFLLVTVIAGLLSSNQPRRAGLPAVASWLILPAVFALLGVALTLLTTVSVTVVGLPFLQDGTAGPAPWAFLLFLAWGFVIELVARFVAPILMPVFPQGLRRLLARMVPAAVEAPTGASGPSTGTTAGPPVDGNVPPTGVGPAPSSPAPLSPKVRRRVIVGSLVAGGALVAGIAAIITIDALESTVYNPDREVSAYLDALRDGDAGAAAAILEPNVGEPLRVLLTNEVFGAAEDRITRYEITDVTTAGDSAFVTADVEQGGVTSSVQFPVRKDGREHVFFDDWQLEAPYSDWIVSLSMPEGTSALTVNGVDIDLPEEGQEPGYSGEVAYELPVYPGSYEIVPKEEAKYLTLGSGQTANVPVEGYGSSRISFEVTPTPALQADAEEQVMSLLSTCIVSTDPEPAGCPMSAYVFYDDEDLRGGSWTLDEEPEFEVSGGYEGGEYSLSSSDGSATYSYEYNSAFGDDEPRWRKESVTVGLYLRADLVVTGDTMTVEADWN